MAQEYVYSIELPNKDKVITIPCQTTAVGSPKKGMLYIDTDNHIKVAATTPGLTNPTWQDPTFNNIRIYKPDSNIAHNANHSLMIGISDGPASSSGYTDTQYLYMEGINGYAGWGSMALGGGANVHSNGSIAAGRRTATYAAYSVALGNNTKTNVAYQLAVGTLNNNVPAGTSSLFVLGNGYMKNGVENRSNAFYITTKGLAFANGTQLTGADYAEMFEWWDQNPKGEDRIGHLVTLNGTKISICGANDKPLGIISGAASVIGDSAGLNWNKKYLTDSFGRIIYDYEEEFIEMFNPETNKNDIVSNGIIPRPRLNPEYNPDEEYIPREERPEWATVGLLGKIYTRDDGTCVPGGYGRPADGGILTYSEEETQFYIMERTDDNIVLVFLK